MTASPARVSVIIPALNEAARIAGSVRSARAAGADQVIVADGGSADGTAAEAREAGADAVVASVPGRAVQMNAGAASATGDILCFLHADTRLPPDGCDAIRDAMRDGSAAGGAFAVMLEVSPSATRWDRALTGLTGMMIGARARLFRCYTGDQAIFVSRTKFLKLGGYDPVPLMEDVRFSAAMRTAGRTVLLTELAVTSARRWETCGPLRTILLMWFLRAAHAFGMSPARCAAMYAVTTPRRSAGA